jgi:hypothetical protein
MMVETALAVVDGCNHQKGCNNVARIMQSKLQDKFAIGIIDDDKYKHSYFNEFCQIAVSDDAILYKHRERNHYFIVICPAMERFILTAAQQCKVSPATYNLPSALDAFMKITKREASKNNKDLKRLIFAIKHSKSACQLAQWIECLSANPCSPKIELL